MPVCCSTRSAVTLYTPWSRPVVHLGLEVVVVTAGVLTFVHAWRARRQGDALPLFTWVTIFVYGVAMELLSYNFIENFVHAQFSVMFYHRKLPLYVTAVYPTLLYTGIATARRFRLPLWAEGFAAGLLIVAMDIPFDIVGPNVGWWSWSTSDPLLAYRWCGVPVTSYYWHLAFGGILAALTTAIAPHLHRHQTAPFGACRSRSSPSCSAWWRSFPCTGSPPSAFPMASWWQAHWPSAWRSSWWRPSDRRGARVLLMALAAAFYAFHVIVAVGAIPMTHLAFLFAAIAFALAVNIAVHGAALVRQRGAAAS